jgi:TPR repeat protein
MMGQYYYADCLFTGIGVKMDKKEALNLFKASASQGCELAQQKIPLVTAAIASQS